MARYQAGPRGAPPMLQRLPVLKSHRKAKRLWLSLDHRQHPEFARVFAASIVERVHVVTDSWTDNTINYAWEKLSFHCNVAPDYASTIFTLRWYLESQAGRPPYNLTTGWLVKNAAEAAVRLNDGQAASEILPLMDDVRPFVDALEARNNLRDHYPPWHDELHQLVGRDAAGPSSASSAEVDPHSSGADEVNLGGDGYVHCPKCRERNRANRRDCWSCTAPLA